MGESSLSRGARGSWSTQYETKHFWLNGLGGIRKKIFEGKLLMQNMVNLLSIVGLTIDL